MSPPAHSRIISAAVALLWVQVSTLLVVPLLLGARAAELPNPLVYALGAVGLGTFLGLGVWGYRRLRQGRGQVARILAEVLVFVVLPAWGIFYNHALGFDTCTITSCDVGAEEFRVLAEPELYGLVALQGVVALAYAASRRWPDPLPGRGESLLQALLIMGLLEHVLLLIQFGKWTFWGLLLPMLILPGLTPLYSLVFLGTALRGRPLLVETPAGPRPVFAHALQITPALLGIYAAAHTAWLGGWGAALAVFTRTCDSPLSQIPVTVIEQADCHYLCTVAARGHPWLVRPLRVGQRRGIPILVNRQLAVANAFEDLLHERWPRFGRLARRTYDRLGLPVSRFIRRPWMSDLVYLAMKPLEWGFYLALRVLDRGDVEARLDRMYR